MSDFVFEMKSRVIVCKDGEVYRGVIAGVTKGVAKYDVQRDGVLSGSGREHDLDTRYLRLIGKPVLVKGVA